MIKDENSLEYYDNILEKVLEKNNLYYSREECFEYELILTRKAVRLNTTSHKFPDIDTWVSKTRTAIKVEEIKDGFSIKVRVFPDILKEINEHLLIKCLWQVVCENMLQSKRWSTDFISIYDELRKYTALVFQDKIKVLDISKQKEYVISGQKLYDTDKILLPIIWLSAQYNSHKHFFNTIVTYQNSLELNNTKLFR